MSDVRENIQIVREVVQKPNVQIGLSVFGALLLGVVLGRFSVPECNREVVCKDLLKDNARLSSIIEEKDLRFTQEKSDMASNLRKELNALCDKKISDSLSDCEFSERLHCPICVARGVCN